MSSVSLIPDTEYILDTIRGMYTAGYSPMLVSSRTDFKGGNIGKVWIETVHNASDLRWDKGEAPPLGLLLEGVTRHPGAGLSVYTHAFRDSSFFPVIFDVDTVDEVVMDEIRTLLPEGMPGWRARNAGSLLGRARTLYDFKSVVQEVDPGDRLVTPSTLKFAGPLGSAKTAEGKPAKIDLLSQHPIHALLPPTLHYAASEAAAKEVRYVWLHDAPRLHDVQVDDLPLIEPWHMLSVHQYAKNSASPFMQLVREMGPGNFHGVMNNACYYLTHEGWSPDYIEQAIVFHMKRLPDFDTPERRRELTVSLMGAKAKVATPKPSQPKGAPRVAPDAEMLMWLEERYPVETLATIVASLCHWDGSHWVDLRGPYEDSLDTDWLFSITQTAFTMHKMSNVLAAVRGFFTKYRVMAPRVVVPPVIPFLDGVYDPIADEFRDERREDYVNGRLAFRWDPSATPLYDAFMLHLLTPPPGASPTPECTQIAINLMDEWYGHSLIPEPRFDQALFVIGKAGVGKSETARLSDKLFPKMWVSRVPASRLDDANAIRNFDRVRLNTSSEMLKFGAKQTDNFLAITGHDDMQMKTLFVDQKTAKATARLLFFGNMMPSLDDRAGEIMRRILVLRTTDNPPADPIFDLSGRIAQAEGPAVLTRWAKALHKLIARNRFLSPPYSRAEIEESVIEGSAFNSWLHERIDPLGPEDSKTSGINLEMMYQDYQGWCEPNGYKYVETKAGFRKRLAAKGHASSGTTTIGGRNGVKIRPYLLRFKPDGIGY